MLLKRKVIMILLCETLLILMIWRVLSYVSDAPTLHPITLKPYPKVYPTTLNSTTKMQPTTLNSTTEIQPTTLKPYPKEGIGRYFNASKDFNSSIFNSFCERHYNVVATLPVYSAAGNFKRRQAIRDTVGKECENLTCAVFFIVGVDWNISLYEPLLDEYMKEKDMLVVSKIDTYRDLNNKAMAMLDWLIKFCSQPKYVIHIIDDTYPNLRYIIDYLETIKDTMYILGAPQARARPVRDPKNKWYIGKSEYPKDFYPAYIFGTVYAFLNTNCKVLKDAAFKAEHIWVEDVWLTGTVRLQAGLTIVRFRKKQLDTPTTSDPNIWNTYYCVHSLSVAGFYDIYNATHNGH